MFPNLNAEQARKGLSNASTANIIGISRNSFENKKRTGKFYVSELNKLCDYFNCDYEYLFRWEDINDKIKVHKNYQI